MTDAQIDLLLNEISTVLSQSGNLLPSATKLVKYLSHGHPPPERLKIEELGTALDTTTARSRGLLYSLLEPSEAVRDTSNISDRGMQGGRNPSAAVPEPSPSQLGV